MGNTVFEHLLCQANKQPSASAFLATSGKTLTYGQLLSHTRSTASYLRSHGIKSQSRVGVIMPNGPELGSAILAVSTCAACVPLNPNFSAAEVKAALSLLRVEAVILAAGSGHRELCRELGLPAFEAQRDHAEPTGIFWFGDGKAIDEDIADWAGPDDIAIIYHTSGTTSRPKVVPITHRNLFSPMPQYIEHFTLSPNDCIIGSTPVYYAFGATVMLTTTVASGGSVAFLPEYSVNTMLSGLKDYKATRFVAAPAVLDAVADHIRQKGLPQGEYRLRFIQTGGTAINPATAALLEGAFGVPVIAGYGLSEIGATLTGNPLPPRRRILESVGVVIHGEVAVMDEKGAFLPTGEQGEIVTRGPAIFSGYENNDEANTEAFSDGWFHTGDRGYVDRSGYLFITGRFKEIINRGGQKIAPLEVDEALMQLPGICEAACFPMPHSRLGEDVAAVVVLKPGALLSAGDIRRMLRSVLADFKIPNRVVFGDAIPKNANGKIQRNNLYSILYEQMPEQFGPGHYVAPRSPMERALAERWQEMLQLDIVSVTDDFFALGGDSLQATILIAEVQERWGKALPASVMMESGTIAELAARIAYNDEPLETLVPIQTAGTQPPLFCIHARDGDVLQYRNLKHYFGSGQPIYALRFVYNEDENPRNLDVPSLASSYVSRIRGIQPTGPYRILGHSFGGIMAYEMACQLSAQGETVELVALLDAGAPGFHSLPLGRKLLQKWNKMRCLSPTEWGSFLADQIRSKAVFLLQRYDRAHRTLYLLMGIAEKYVPPRYNGDVVMFRAMEDMENLEDKFDRSMGWDQYVRGNLHIVEVPGTHTTFLLEPNVQVLAGEMKKFYMVDEAEVCFGK